MPRKLRIVLFFLKIIFICLTPVILIAQNTNKTEQNEIKNNVKTNNKLLSVKSLTSKLDSLSDTLKQKSKINIQNKTDTNQFLLMEMDTSAKEELTDIIVYSAKDSAQLQVEKSNILLFKESTAKYGDMEAKGDIIKMDQSKKKLSLYPLKDSFNNIKLKDKTKFKQGGTEYLSDSVIFNYENKQGVTKNSFTTQGDLFIWSKISKKVNEEDVFSQDIRLSTCGLDHPHFGFKSPKGMFKKEKVGVTSSLYVEVEGISFPIPIAPFALFPISMGVRDGFIFPEYVQAPDRGIGIRNGGYYMKFGDYADARITGDIYSYGSWGISMANRYVKKYHFQGNLGFTYQKVYISKPGDTAPNNVTTMSLNLNHQTDAKAMPNANFTIGINYSSTRHNSLLLTNNPSQNIQNQIGSSISFAQRFKKIPLSFTIGSNMSQNNQTKRYDVSFPDLNVNVNNILPLENLGLGGAWYNKIAFNHTMTARGTTFFFDSVFSPAVQDNFRWGVQQNPSLTLPLPAIGPFQITPSISYSEVWMDRKTFLKYNPTGKKIDTTINKGFYRSNDANFSISLATSLFGTWLFSNSSPIRGIRNVIRPTVSFSYKPNLNAHNYYTLVDSNKVSSKRSYFEGGIYSPFGETEFMGLNFGISSSLEMKVRNRKDSLTGTKKIVLIDAFNIGGSYNMSKDTNITRRLSDISMSLTTNIAQKLNLSANAIYNPYALDSLGNDNPKTYSWQQDKIQWGTFKNFSLNLSTSFNGKAPSNSTINNGLKSIKKQSTQEEKLNHFLFNDTSQTSNYNNYFQNWSLNIGYNLNYNFSFDRKTKTQTYILGSHALSLSGSVNLTNNWRIGFSSNITLQDFRPEIFQQSKMNTLSLTIYRDLHCWEINASITPIGPFRSISFTINPKSGILRDLKLQKNRFYTQ